MFKNLEVFRTAMSLAQHAGQNQAVVARNIANADTPGFQAQSVSHFAEIYDAPMQSALRQTRAGHFESTHTNATSFLTNSQSESSPNGNSVSVEEEMLKSVEIQREHSRALAIYRHSLDLMRISIGRK
ncbi:FlgB family protein [Aestuariibius sp. HNIBRBA575]|uniref:FlgB family protein n=1 Tax=Aestuariibius sp. HNIBRBA575 TaxID=3233343 RepID=UPI0034A31330